MAARVNNVHPFVSSNAYYGYQPINPQQQQQQRQQLIDNDVGMDVDNGESLARAQNNNNDSLQQRKEQTSEFLMSVDEAHRRRWSQGRKRGFDRDEVANYMPCFKRLRDETMVTNHVFSMVQETASGPKSTDWPRCTMSRYYA